MAEENRDQQNPTGVGPGITGASGDLIQSTGEGHGIGGTGHDDEHDAAGERPDERQLPGPQDAMEQAEGSARRPSGSETGMIGGGGPDAEVRDRRDPGEPGGGGGGALGDVPGGLRNVTPANDQTTAGDAAHRRKR